MAAQPYARIIDAAAAGSGATGAFRLLEHFAFEWHTAMTRDARVEQTSTAGGQVEAAYTTVAAVTRRVRR